jgi:hypothetical protein
MYLARFLFFLVITCILFLSATPAAAITVEELAAKCEKMETEIKDVSLRYIVHYTASPEERAERFPDPTQVLISITDPNYKLAVSTPSNPNDLNSPEKWMMKMEISEKVKGGPDNDVWDSNTISSYNGEISKKLVIGNSSGSYNPDASISEGLSYETYPWYITPLGYSVFELSIDTFRTRLSDWLKGKKGPVNLSDKVEKIEGFDTIRADLFIEFHREGKTHIYNSRRVYFSIDHDYYPVKYEFMGAKGETVEGNVVKYQVATSYSHNVASLAEIQKGIYFPDSGFVSEPNEPLDAIWYAVGEIAVNQGLEKEDLDITFPPGTEVKDKIRGIEYVVRPTEGQFEQILQSFK